MNKAFLREPEPDGRACCPRCQSLGSQCCAAPWTITFNRALGPASVTMVGSAPTQIATSLTSIFTSASCLSNSYNVRCIPKVMTLRFVRVLVLRSSNWTKPSRPNRPWPFENYWPSPKQLRLVVRRWRLTVAAVCQKSSGYTSAACRVSCLAHALFIWSSLDRQKLTDITRQRLNGRSPGCAYRLTRSRRRGDRSAAMA